MPQPVELAGLEKPVAAQRVHKAPDVFQTDKTATAGLCKERLDVQFCSRAIEEGQRGNPSWRDKKDTRCVAKRITKDQPGRLGDWRRDEVQSLSQTRKNLTHRSRSSFWHRRRPWRLLIAAQKVHIGSAVFDLRKGSHAARIVGTGIQL